MKIDFNCFVGGWPFHKVRNNTFAALRKLHEENEINGGYVSSTNAIFFNDPYEAERELAAAILNDSYHHVMTVNPTLPGCFGDIIKGLRDFNIKGVRIMPGFHGYDLNCKDVDNLCTLLHELHLPLFLTLRMEDERITYLLHPKSISNQEVRSFLNAQAEIPILLNNVRLRELIALKDILLTRENIYADCCGLKDSLFVLEKLDSEDLTKRLVYGSLAPIFCLRSSLLLVEMSNIEEETKNAILSGEGFNNICNQGQFDNVRIR